MTTPLQNSYPFPKRSAAGVLILDEAGRALALRKPGDFYGFPMGKLDPGEEYMAAAARETWEETGAIVEIDRETPPFLQQEGETMVALFRARILRWDPDFVPVEHEGVPEFVDPRLLCEGRFSTFNLAALRYFNVP